MNENLQREDIHPLEEAWAFQALLKTDGLQYDIPSLGTKVGKSPAFVAKRLRLTELIMPIAEAFLADQIGVGHALEIAKLPQPEQQWAFDAVFRTVWTGGKETRVPLPVRELTAWIVQNILLSLNSVPFDKNDETLVPEAGSCLNCPKRTGFNTLLFDAAVKDSCTDSSCYNNKLGKHIERQLAEKSKLVQITTGYGTHDNGNVLPRGRYVALSLSSKNRNSKAPISPYQKPCKQMSEAIVVDGSERGRIVKVCADPSCSTHVAERRAPDPEQITKQRERRRKELEKQRLEITIRHRTLAEVLKRIGSPLDRADLALVAIAIFNKLEPLSRELLARRHKLTEKTDRNLGRQTHQAIIKMIAQAEEAVLSKLLIEITLLEVVDNVSVNDGDLLTATAKRHRVDVVKARKAVEEEFTAKQARQAAKQKKTAKKNPAKPAA